ncbi:MAG TPA: ATP-binding protein [Acidobacteriaceae bacterium]|jgi:signal transduction histidine kinase|nr:ATP-binding protein [Acidobacteriaceae bacterium]
MDERTVGAEVDPRPDLLALPAAPTGGETYGLQGPGLPKSGLGETEMRATGLGGPGLRGPGLRAKGGDALTLRGMAHDAQNLVTGLRLCADLIAEPGVLAEPHRHFAVEVGSIADASERLVRRLATLGMAVQRRSQPAAVEAAITDLPGSVRYLSGLLSAIAGPGIGIETACLPCRGTLRMGEENLTRILVNLVRNAADAMPQGGHVRITVQRGDGSSFFWTLHENDTASGTADLWDDAGPARTVVLTVEDDGPGIPGELLERVFEPGFSTHRDGRPWPLSPHHGLGLSLVRHLVEEAGGTVRAAAVAGRRGTRIEMVLPLTNVMPDLPSEPGVHDGSSRE